MQTKTNPLLRNRLAGLMTEATPVAIILTDSMGIIEALSDSGLHRFGYKATELVGQSIELLFPSGVAGDDASHQACNLSRLSDSDPHQAWSISGRRCDGSTFPTKLTWHRLQTAEGETRLAHVIEFDQGDAKTVGRIEGERLAAVMQMVSGLAHESRNALQRAQSCLDLLQLDLENQTELKGLVDTIGDALKDIHRNYEEVKSYAAPITLKRTPVNLTQLCQITFDELAQPLGTFAPHLQLHTDNACESVSLDASRFQDVLRHALNNAIHVSQPDSTIEFHCSCHDLAECSSTQISVRDHGVGLNAEVEARMFEPFYTTKLQGIGLGLAVCRRIVEAHDGTIQASNHPSGGAVIEIRLPM